MSNKKTLRIINVIAIIAYIMLIGYFLLRLVSLDKDYINSTKQYVTEIEKELKDVIDSENQLALKLKQLKDKYPMEIAISLDNEIVFNTLPYKANENMIERINRKGLIIESQGGYKVGNNTYNLWYAIYNRPDSSFFHEVFREYSLIISLFLLIFLTLFFILQRILLGSLKGIRRTVDKATNLEYDDSNKDDNVIVKQINTLVQDVNRSVQAVSRQHTSLEQQLQLSREYLNNTITISKSLIHDLKSPVHQAMLENELFLRHLETPDVNVQQLAEENIKANNDLMLNINEILSMLNNNTNINGGQIEVFDMVEEYVKASRLFRERFVEKKINIDFIAPENVRVKGNRVSFVLLLHNLLSNMAQYGKSSSDAQIIFEQDDEFVTMIFKNESSATNIERMRNSEKLFNVVEENKEHIYSSGNGLFLIKDLSQLLHGAYNLRVSNNQVVISVRLPNVVNG